MKDLKTAGAILGIMVLAVLAPTGTALATGLDGAGAVGSTLTAESEATTKLHPPFGSINCQKSHVGGKTTNEGSVGENVNGNIEALSFSECNATVTVLAKGSFSVAWTSGSNGTLYGTGQEVTVVYLGFHCIFKTNSTKLGTLTGSAATGSNATLDIEATIPRTGGSSGAFCGSTAQWTGAYKFTTPNPLNVTDEGELEGEGPPLRVTPGALNFFLGVMQEKSLVIERSSATSVKVENYSFMNSTLSGPFTGIDITNLEGCLTNYTFGTACNVTFKDTRTTGGHGFLVLQTDHGTKYIGIHVT